MWFYYKSYYAFSPDCFCWTNDKICRLEFLTSFIPGKEKVLTYKDKIYAGNICWLLEKIFFWKAQAFYWLWNTFQCRNIDEQNVNRVQTLAELFIYQFVSSKWNECERSWVNPMLLDGIEPLMLIMIKCIREEEKKLNVLCEMRKGHIIIRF